MEILCKLSFKTYSKTMKEKFSNKANLLTNVLNLTVCKKLNRMLTCLSSKGFKCAMNSYTIDISSSRIKD